MKPNTVKSLNACDDTSSLKQAEIFKVDKCSKSERTSLNRAETSNVPLNSASTTARRGEPAQTSGTVKFLERIGILGPVCRSEPVKSHDMASLQPSLDVKSVSENSNVRVQKPDQNCSKHIDTGSEEHLLPGDLGSTSSPTEEAVANWS